MPYNVSKYKAGPVSAGPHARVNYQQRAVFNSASEACCL